MTGFRQLYAVGIAGGWFNHADLTPFQAVFDSDFVSFVEMIAIRNSRQI